ncbi:MAG: hypothetical protein JSS04_10990 [Proteobacteria bacterium]|nr:hypothetical protein [Pseudomonadota bacterium]
MTNRVDSIPGEGGHVLGQRSATLVDQCIVSGGSFLLNVLLARSLAAADYGEFALFLGGVFVLRQIDGSLVSFPLSVRLSLEAEDDRPGLLGKTALLSALLSLVLASAMAVGIALLGATEILLPACLCFLCWQAQEASRRFLFAEFRYREAVIGDGIAYVGQVILVAALLWLHSITLSSALYVISAAFAIGAAAHTARLRFVWPAFSVMGRELRALALEYLSVGKWILASYQLRLVRGQLIPWMLALVAGTAATASLQAALNIANTMNPIILGVANAIPQSAAHAYRSGGVRGAVRMSYGYALFGLWPILAICAACVTMPDLLLRTVYGHESPYLAAAVGLQLLVVAGVLDYIAEVVGLTLLGVNSGKLAFAVNLMALLAALVLAAAFIGPLGILGACVALVGANLVRVIAGLIAIVWRIDRESSRDPLEIGIRDDGLQTEQAASVAAEQEDVSRKAALQA